MTPLHEIQTQIVAHINAAKIGSSLRFRLMDAADAVSKAIEAEGLQTRPKGDWLPIWTAPQDGSSIMVWATNYPTGAPVIVHWIDDRASPEPIPRWESRDVIYDTFSFVDHPPAWWMPLPMSPADGEAA